MISQVLDKAIHGSPCLVLDVERVKGCLETGYHFVPGFLVVWDGGIIEFVELSF